MEGTLLAGRYVLLEELGSGGMGVVYRATDRHTGGLVAVKLLHPLLARDPEYRERLRREAHLAASLTSPRVVRVIDLAEHDGIPFLVMEYVPGETLEERLRREGRLPLEEALQLGLEVARALAAAYACGIVHRDLKPQNIKLVDGQVKVLDFGIARAEGLPGLTSATGFVGTPEYCAPERIEGLGDVRADIYALGVVLYLLIAGRLPFQGGTLLQMLHQHATAPVPALPADVPHPVRTLVARCLAKDPAQRYQTPGDLVGALDTALASLRGAPAAQAHASAAVAQDPAQAPGAAALDLSGLPGTPAPPVSTDGAPGPPAGHELPTTLPDSVAPTAHGDPALLAPAPTIATEYVLPHPARRHVIVLGAGGLLLAAGAGGALVAVRGGWPLRLPWPPAGGASRVAPPRVGPPKGALLYQAALDRAGNDFWPRWVIGDPAASDVRFRDGEVELAVLKEGGHTGARFKLPHTETFVTELELKVRPDSNVRLLWTLRGDDSAAHQVSVETKTRELSLWYTTPARPSRLVVPRPIPELQSGRVVGIGVVADGQSYVLYLDGQYVARVVTARLAGRAGPVGLAILGSGGAVTIVGLRVYALP